MQALVAGKARENVVEIATAAKRAAKLGEVAPPPSGVRLVARTSQDIDIRLGPWERVLKDVHDESVRLILTSPPYGEAREYEGKAPAVNFDALAAFALRVLVPGGVLAMVIDGTVDDGVASTLPFEIIASWARRPGWRLQQVLAYGRQGAPGEYAGRFRRDHELLPLFVKDGARHVCHKDDVAEQTFRDPNAVGISSGQRKRDGSVRIHAVDPEGNRREQRPIRHRGSIWWYGAVGHGHDASSSTGHPATFAERFAIDAVRVWSNPGELVVDPFLGSGTTAVACAKLGRMFVGSEVVPTYHEMAQRRVDAALPAAMSGPAKTMSARGR